MTLKLVGVDAESRQKLESILHHMRFVAGAIAVIEIIVALMAVFAYADTPGSTRRPLS